MASNSWKNIKSKYPSDYVQVLLGDLTYYSLGKRAVDLAVSKWGKLDGMVLNHRTLGPVDRIVNNGSSDWKSCLMQKHVRVTHAATQDLKDVKLFKTLHKRGTLSQPHGPGNVLAKLVLDCFHEWMPHVSIPCPERT